MEMTAQGTPYVPPMMPNNSYMQPTYPRQSAYIPQAPQVPQMPPRKIADLVQGELAATIYPVNFPGQEIYMFDIDDPEKAYRRFRDEKGNLSPLYRYKLVPIEDVKEEPQQINLSEYVKESDVLDLINDTVKSEVEKRLSEILKKGSDSK